MKTTVEFYFGFGSRFSYLASTQIPALERDLGVHVAWRATSVGALVKARGGQNPFVRDASGNWSGVVMSGQYDETYRRTDLARWARFYDVPYNEPPPPVMDSTRRALYAVAAELQGLAAPFSRALFASIYEDTTATAEDDCLGIARAVGLDEKKLQDDLASGAAQSRHDVFVTEAMASRAFGVPTFIVGKELFWGNDRLVLLRDHLKRTNA